VDGFEAYFKGNTIGIAIRLEGMVVDSQGKERIEDDSQISALNSWTDDSVLL
jgi:hypothetical protein